MTPLDQAFIKAYRQQGGVSAQSAVTGPLDSAQPVLLADALKDHPLEEAPSTPAEVSIDDVLEVLQNPPTRIADPLPPEQTPQTPQHEGDDQPSTILALDTVETTPPAFARTGSIHTEEDDVEVAPKLEELGLPDIVHRVDQGTSAEPTASQTDTRPVPPTHIEVTRADAPEGAGAPAYADAPKAQAPGGESVAAGFRPMLQVDHFIWPTVCRRLSGEAADELDRLTDGLLDVMAEGHKVVAIGGCRRGEGATTLLLCAGRRLAERGLKVVIADADLTDPQLGRRLGLLPQFGWEEVLAGRLPLEEVVIESVGDRLAVLPVREAFAGSGGTTEDETRLAAGIETLATHYDLVLVDLGPLEDPAVVGGWLARGVGRRLDAIALVHNRCVTSREDLVETERSLAATDIVQVGIIENLVRD